MLESSARLSSLEYRFFDVSLGETVSLSPGLRHLKPGNGRSVKSQHAFVSAMLTGAACTPHKFNEERSYVRLLRSPLCLSRYLQVNYLS